MRHTVHLVEQAFLTEDLAIVISNEGYLEMQSTGTARIKWWEKVLITLNSMTLTLQCKRGKKKFIRKRRSAEKDPQ